MKILQIKQNEGDNNTGTLSAYSFENGKIKKVSDLAGCRKLKPK